MRKSDAHFDNDGLSAQKSGELGGEPLVVRNEALPEDENFPAEFPEPLQVSPVTSQGALELFPPERHVFPRHGASAASPMPVPEASMNQDDLLSTGKDEIGLTGQVRSMKSVSVSEPGQHTTDHLFGRGVARTDPLHSTGGFLVSGVDHCGRHDRILLRPFLTNHCAASIRNRVVWDRLRPGERLGDEP